MEKDCECYEEEVQPYRKIDYKPIIYLLIGGTHNKQGSNDAHVQIVLLLLTLSLIKSHKYFGAVLLTALCVKSKILKIILS